MTELQILQKAKILQMLRRFFERKDFIELDTAILQSKLVPELHVNSFHVFGSLGDGYLLPSPELAMKKLLCDWNLNGQPHSVYQMAHCFRQEEELDALHFPEFLMLEFYALGYSTMQLLDLLAELLSGLQAELPPHLKQILASRPLLLSFDELCLNALNLEFDSYWNAGISGVRELYTRASGREASAELDLDDLFHLFLVEFLEPYIAKELPYCVLYPYPDVTPLPAKQLDYGGKGLVTLTDNPYLFGGWVDRWELYLNGVELANACAEENRPQYLGCYQQRFSQDLVRQGRSSELAKFDLAALDLWQHLPDCCGAALGVDRLLAL